MNVFILCTGRCGSTTFIKACSHISNFSAAHESRTAFLGSSRFDYPKRHIEADNRLSWLLGRLDRAYANQAYYVHLRRNVMDTARSFIGRYDRGIMQAYRGAGIIMGLGKEADPMEVAIDYCETVNTNIDAFLRNKANVMRIDLEEASKIFPQFCSWIEAEVDMGSALSEFNIRHNATRSITPDA